MMMPLENHRVARVSPRFPASPPDAEPPRLGAYLLVAIVALITGLIIGLSVGQARRGAPAEWSSPAPAKPHPRALEP